MQGRKLFLGAGRKIIVGGIYAQIKLKLRILTLWLMEEFASRMGMLLRSLILPAVSFDDRNVSVEE